MTSQTLEIAAATQFTPNQIAWIKSHDWFCHEGVDGSIAVYERITFRGTFSETVKLWTGSFRELRDWAGY
jgi:hypothetical protein